MYSDYIDRSMVHRSDSCSAIAQTTFSSAWHSLACSQFWGKQLMVEQIRKWILAALLWIKENLLESLAKLGRSLGTSSVVVDVIQESPRHLSPLVNHKLHKRIRIISVHHHPVHAKFTNMIVAVTILTVMKTTTIFISIIVVIKMITEFIRILSMQDKAAHISEYKWQLTPSPNLFSISGSPSIQSVKASYHS